MVEIMQWEELYELVKPCYYEGKCNEIIDGRTFSDFYDVESSNQETSSDVSAARLSRIIFTSSFFAGRP